MLQTPSPYYSGGCFGRDSITRSIRTGKSKLYDINACTYVSTYTHMYVRTTFIGPFTYTSSLKRFVKHFKL